MDFVNILVISGEVVGLRKNYSSKGNVFFSFALRQKKNYWKDNRIVKRSYSDHHCNCFDDEVWKIGGLKEGSHATITGRVESYETDAGENVMNIVVDRIYYHGELQQSERQGVGVGVKKASV